MQAAIQAQYSKQMQVFKLSVDEDPDLTVEDVLNSVPPERRALYEQLAAELAAMDAAGRADSEEASTSGLEAAPEPPQSPNMPESFERCDTHGIPLQ